MINGATVTLAGYVATEPNYRTIKGKTPIASMRVAWTQRYLDRETGEWRDGSTSFATVNCWRKLAGNVAPSLRKGHAVVVTGRLRVRESADAEGTARRIYVEIEADAIGHDLSRGVSHFMRTSPSRDNADGGGAAGDEAISPGPDDADAADGPSGAPGGSHDDLFVRDAVAGLAGAGDGSAAAGAPAGTGDGSGSADASAAAEESSAAVVAPF